MEMKIDFPGGLRVDADFFGTPIHTDQPVQGGGSGTAPTPFALFLGSIGTCAGIYVLHFCRTRGLPTEGVHIVQRLDFDRRTGMITEVELDIHVPEGFPEKYHQALIRSADQCAVKKHMETPPSFNTHVTVG